MHIRSERPADADAIRHVTALAFAAIPESDQTEPAIVDALRADEALSVSLVAIDGDGVIGHVAFSPVEVGDIAHGWHGLGPVSVLPGRQGQGIGQALIRQGLEMLKSQGAAGCVVLGDPAYYGRFGFESDPAIRYGAAVSPYLQRRLFHGPSPAGEVRYHPSFG